MRDVSAYLSLIGQGLWRALPLSLTEDFLGNLNGGGTHLPGSIRGR